MSDLEDRRAYNKAYRLKNAARMAAQDRAYHLAHQAERNAYNKQYRAENAEAIRAKDQIRREKDREAKRLYAQRYRAEHKDMLHQKLLARSEEQKERRRAEMRASHARHREERCAKKRLFYATHPDIIKQQRQQYRQRHLPKILARNASRRAQKRQILVNDLTAAQWREIKAAYKHCCVYCGRKMQRLTQDHITPLSQGGNHTASNVVPACPSCNSRKQAGPPLCPVQPLLLTIAPAREEKTG